MQIVGSHNGIQVAVNGIYIMHKIRDSWVKAIGKVPDKLDGEMGYDYRIRVMYEYLEFNTFPIINLTKENK